MHKLLFINIFIIGYLLLSPLTAMSQKPITDPQVLDSFAKIIRDKQYSCQSCELAQPTGSHDKIYTYKAICKHNYTYEVFLTPNSDMIVKPVMKNLLVHGKAVNPGQIVKIIN